jgi:hypothetical protein
MRRLLCKSALQAFKTGGESFRLATDSKTEMIGHTEKPARHDVRVIIHWKM